MSAVSQREPVHAPLAWADSLVTAYLHAHPAPGGTGASVVLRARDINEPAIITIVPAHEPADMTPRYAVHWSSEHGSALPVFDGILTVEADEDYNSFQLAIKGSYEPPGGLAGALFDAVLGNRIATETTRNLLTDIRAFAESEFQRQERSKPHPAI